MEETKRAKSRWTLLRKLRALANALDELIARTGEPAGMEEVIAFAAQLIARGIARIGEPAGMEEVVEFAAQHMGFSDHEALAKLFPCIRNRVPYCGHECAYQTASMNPAMWSGLLEELLQCVFARLSLGGIIRLRCLSKQWNGILNSHDFKQVCADASSKMFAIISGSCYSGRFEVRLYDFGSNTWHDMEIDTGYLQPFHTMNAFDGGLVCFACTSAKEEPIHVPVLVCNPLTCAVRALPLHSHSKHPPKMLQLVMDRITKCYKVLIVCTDPNGGLVAEVFHSNSGAWISTNMSDIKYFWGYRYSWFPYEDVYNKDAEAPCVYDCAKGRFRKIPIVGDLLRQQYRFSWLKRYALVQDRVFVLRLKERRAIKGGGFSEPGYYIAEFQAVDSGAKWLKLKDHRCSSLGNSALDPHYSPGMHACKGFLLVFDHSSAGEHGLERLYDLSSGKWYALSREFLQGITYLDVMCELQWDAIP